MKGNQTLNVEIFSTFYLDSTEVALNVQYVQEVVNFPERIIPMPLAPKFLVGVFNLRGMIIPVINTKQLLKFDSFELDQHQKIAIVDFEGAKVGLVFDKTSEILRVNKDTINHFNYSNENDKHVVKGAIKLNGGARILQIIDPQSLVMIENLPQIIDQQKIVHSSVKSQAHLSKTKKCISFSVASMKMAFEISGIHEIVKVPEIQHSSMKSDSFLGVINLRGQTIPVVSFAKLLHVCSNEERSKEDDRIVVLKIENELFGLLVDSVESINSYSVEDIMPLPLLNSERTQMFFGCLDLKELGEVFLLNHQSVLENKEIIELTQGHSKMYQTLNANETKKKSSGNKQTYISFRLTHLFGVAIKDIKEIIEYDNEVIQAPGLPSFVNGMLNLRGKLVSIVDTRKLYKLESSCSITEKTKILIFERNNENFGLIVDSVENIVTVDSDKNLKVPELLTKQVKDQFQQDIKEIISIPLEDTREAALIILNIEPVSARIKAAA